MSKNAHKLTDPSFRGNPGVRAFTIIELLAVIGIIAVMMVTVVPAINGIKGSGDVTRGAYDVAGTLEQARAYAMANNTYVFVGLTERNAQDASQPGIGQVLVIAMGSKDGTRTFSASNLVPLSKLRRFASMHLEDSLPNTGSMSRPVVQDAYRVANDASKVQVPLVSSGYQFDKIIQFSPRGMASIQSDTVSIPQWLEIGLVASRGDTLGSKQNCAALVLDGVTGTTKIYRP